MEGSWTRALVESKQLHDFCQNGISPAQERRKPPSYIPAVFSVPIESGFRSRDEEYLSSTDSEEETNTCFNLKKTKPIKKPIPIRKRSKVLEKVPSFRATENNPNTLSNIRKVCNSSRYKPIKSESMSVIKSDQNDKTITEEVTKYASNPEVSKSSPVENELLLTKDNESITSLDNKPFKYKSFLTLRYSTDLEVENKMMKNILMNTKTSLNDKRKQFKVMKTNAFDECQYMLEEDQGINLIHKAYAKESDIGVDPTLPLLYILDDPSSPLLDKFADPSSPLLDILVDPSSPFLDKSVDPSSPLLDILVNPTSPLFDKPDDPSSPLMVMPVYQSSPLLDIPVDPSSPLLDILVDPSSPLMNVPPDLNSPLLDMLVDQTSPLLDIPLVPSSSLLDIPVDLNSPLMDMPVNINSQMLFIPVSSQNILEVEVLEEDNKIEFRATEPPLKCCLDGRLEEISKYASFDDYGQPIDCDLANKVDEQKTCEEFESDTFSVHSSSNISDIQVDEHLDTFPVVNDNNNTEDILQKDGSLIVTSNLSNIEDENRSNMEKGLSYATFDETGAIVSRTLHEEKCSENSCPAEHLCSESLIKDLSLDGTKKINGEISQIFNHHNSLINSISKVKHQQDQSLTKIFKQQDSVDSSTSTKSSDVPDLEVLSAHSPCYSPVTNYLPFLLPSNPVSPRSGIVFVDTNGRVLAGSAEKSLNKQTVIKEVRSRLLSGTLPPEFCNSVNNASNNDQ